MEFGLSFDDVLLVPKRTRARSRKLVDLASQLTPRLRLQIPILSANVPWCTEAPMAIMMAQLGGLGIIHRMNLPEQQVAEVRQVKAHTFAGSDYPHASVDHTGRLRVGAAIGVRGDWARRAEELVQWGADVLVVDIAHGHADSVIEVLEQLKATFPATEIIAGNVATGEGTADLISAGADAIKVGIGPGAVCTTRMVTGCGVPQLTAIRNCVDVASRYDIPIIADGGIRTSGDITKALAAGATTVMLGTMLAGVTESAAQLVEVDGESYKISTGFVTLGMQLTLKHKQTGQITREELDQYVPEGVEATFPYSGELAHTIHQLVGGVKSGMSYCGAMSIDELHQKAAFIRVSSAGFAEGMPHVLSSTKQVHPDYKTILAG
ncbi:Inosine-5'-monophosphate dehydrogenase [Candidatus Entotheonellaceae bacterium PAL068K]